MLRKTLISFLVLVCTFGQVKAQTFINDKVDIIAGSGSYLINEVVYKPANFNTATKYPLVLFFHGMGEAGTDVNRLYSTGLPKVLKDGYKPSFDFIMVAPQHSSYSLDPKYIEQIINETLIKFPNIDQSRIYLTGLSAGGWGSFGGVMNVSETVAKKFAAIVVMSGATQDVNKTNYAWWKSSNVHLWAVVGNNDISYRDQNQDLVNKVNAQVPGLATITIRSGVGHGGWNDVYNGIVKTASGKTMWEYLYQFSLGGTTTPPPANTAPSVNAGTDKTMTLPTNSTALAATATDADGSIASMAWTKISGPAQYSLSSTTTSNPTLSNLAEGTYTFRFTATDNLGATSSDDINIVVNGTTTTPPPTGGIKYVKTQLFGGSNGYTSAEWNKWNVSSSLSSGSFKYSDGTTSSINAVLSQQNSVSDNGTNLNYTMAPKEAVRYASYSTSTRTLTISGLNDAKTYDLEMYASRTGITNNTTRFTLTTGIVDIRTDNNTGNKALFSAVRSVGGTITITISKLNAYNYLNGFTIVEKD